MDERADGWENGGRRGLPEGEWTAWRRLKAGLMVEMGLAAPRAVRACQQRVREGDHDPEACALAILGEGETEGTEARLLTRSARLQRDLIMAPLTRGLRGAGRRARETARGGLAMLVAQVMVLTIHTAIIALALLVARIAFDFSIDGFLDGLRALVPI